MRSPGGLFSADDQIHYNREMHDHFAPLYEVRHGEIFNPTEQCRIHDILQPLLAGFKSYGAPMVLDFGAGTGNLTRHLLALGAEVTAADLSAGCLEQLRKISGRNDMLRTLVLDGNGLQQFPDSSFHMVTAYSVLHHIPDYLASVDEFVRVVKPGGIIYIDHEVNPDYWEDNPEYHDYCSDLANRQPGSPRIIERLKQLITGRVDLRYLRAWYWLQRNPKADEGDIHVHRHDHIEWPAIRRSLEPFCEIVSEQDYLICRERLTPPPVWERWHSRCTDMRLLVARKF